MEQPVEELAPARVSMHRRTLLKGAAWTVPAVLLVGTTPAFAASNLKLNVTGITSTVNKKVFTFVLTVANPNTAIVTVSSIQFATSAGWTFSGPASTNFGPNSATGTLSFTATVGDSSSGNDFPSFAFTLIDTRSGYNVDITTTAGTAPGIVAFS